MCRPRWTHGEDESWGIESCVVEPLRRLVGYWLGRRSGLFGGWLILLGPGCRISYSTPWVCIYIYTPSLYDATHLDTNLCYLWVTKIP